MKKYGQPHNIVGIIAVLLFLFICYQQWVFVAPRNWSIGGMHVPVDKDYRFGRPAMLSVILSAMQLVLFLIPAVWSKRVNVYICMLSIGWSIRGFLLLTRCEAGYCPEKLWPIYVYPLLAVAIMLINVWALLVERSKKTDIVSPID
jgi:hypothetical protein